MWCQNHSVTAPSTALRPFAKPPDSIASMPSLTNNNNTETCRQCFCLTVAAGIWSKFLFEAVLRWFWHTTSQLDDILCFLCNFLLCFAASASAWSGPVRTGTQYQHFYISAFRVPALFCAYRHFWHAASTQIKIVRVWVIRLNDQKLHRNYVKHTTLSSRPIMWMNASRAYFIVWCTRRGGGVRGGAWSCRIIMNYWLLIWISTL